MMWFSLILMMSCEICPSCVPTCPNLYQKCISWARLFLLLPSLRTSTQTHRSQSQCCFNANANLCFAVCLWSCLLLQGSTFLLRQQLFQLRSWPLLTQIILEPLQTSSENMPKSKTLAAVLVAFLGRTTSVKLSNERYSKMTQIVIWFPSEAATTSCCSWYTHHDHSDSYRDAAATTVEAMVIITK